MSRRLDKAVSRWLQDEHRDAAEAADVSLRRVFRALPAPPLPAGFADRVMLRAGLAPPPSAATPLGWRIALVGALILAAGAVATVPPVAFGVLRRFSLGDVIRLGAEAIVEVCQRLAEGLAVWQTINSIGGTLAEALSAPPILAALLTAALLSAGGLRMLHGLLAVDRRSENVRA
jgi:anti-sigma factor RsiW